MANYYMVSDACIDWIGISSVLTSNDSILNTLCLRSSMVIHYYSDAYICIIYPDFCRTNVSRVRQTCGMVDRRFTNR